MRITPKALADLVALAERKAINSNTAKEIFAGLFAEGGDPNQIVRDKGLAQVSDSGALESLAAQAIAENPKSAEDYRKGKTAALKFLVGQVMKLSKGKANPQVVADILQARLNP